FQVMVMQFRTQHKVAGARANRLSLALDVPVDLAPHDHPPLVMLVVVRIVRRTWRVDDHKRLDIVTQQQWLCPRPILGAIRNQLVEARVKIPRIQYRKFDGHAIESTAPSWPINPGAAR